MAASSQLAHVQRGAEFQGRSHGLVIVAYVCRLLGHPSSLEQAAPASRASKNWGVDRLGLPHEDIEPRVVGIGHFRGWFLHTFYAPTRALVTSAPLRGSTKYPSGLVCDRLQG